jgi:hypothetical protein
VQAHVQDLKLGSMQENRIVVLISWGDNKSGQRLRRARAVETAKT